MPHGTHALHEPARQPIDASQEEHRPALRALRAPVCVGAARMVLACALLLLWVTPSSSQLRQDNFPQRHDIERAGASSLEEGELMQAPAYAPPPPYGQLPAYGQPPPPSAPLQGSVPSMRQGYGAVGGGVGAYQQPAGPPLVTEESMREAEDMHAGVAVDSLSHKEQIRKNHLARQLAAYKGWHPWWFVVSFLFCVGSIIGAFYVAQTWWSNKQDLAAAAQS